MGVGVFISFYLIFWEGLIKELGERINYLDLDKNVPTLKEWPDRVETKKSSKK